MGLLLSALAITITCTRLLTGVHYLTDILASILIALAIYIINEIRKLFRFFNFL